jgi:hypothetical protein
MHLLKQSADGTLSLKLFYNNIPRYAILSHRWVGEEPSFQDIQQGVGHGKEGFEKLRFCARKAAKDEFEYFWVDTVRELYIQTACEAYTDFVHSPPGVYQQRKQRGAYGSSQLNVSMVPKRTEMLRVPVGR